jgi:hypothetical protein
MMILVRLFFLWHLSLFSLLYAGVAEDTAKKAHLANINALLIFTSQKDLNSGQYHFSKVGVDMEVYSLPFTYDFKSDDKWDYFILGNIGYSRTFNSDDIVTSYGSRLDYDNHLRTYTAGLGTCIRYKVNSYFHVLSGFELIYSRSGASVKKPDDDTGDAIEDFFTQNYNDNISYKLFSSAEYRQTYYEFKPYIILDFKLYETKSSFTFDRLDDFTTQSNVSSFIMGIETPNIFEYIGNYLAFEGYIHANYSRGDVVKSVQFENMVVSV